jgi:phosphate:Na+ symporter
MRGSVVFGEALPCSADPGGLAHVRGGSTEETTVEIDWLQLGMGLFGGLALFLGGLDQLSEGLKQAAGRTLKVVLERLTSNRLSGALTGAIVTGVLNSSSVTTVLVVGFVTAGVMTLSQSVGVIMGANIGSTVTAQVLAFNIAAYALGPVALGFFMTFAGRSERVRQVGMMVMGLGLVFFGMGLMSDAMRPLRSYPPFIELLASMERPVLGVLAGALFTALVQSSAATVGIAIALASEGLLSLGGGITLALGANIGTCATALLATIGKPPAAVRASIVHLVFNVLGVVVWLPLLSVLADLAVRVSPAAPELAGAARAAAEVPRQLANANTMFNVINTAIFLPFTAVFARLAERLVKEKPPARGALIEPRFLDEAALAAPTLALENARRETGRLAEIVQQMLVDVGPAVRERSVERFETLRRHAEETAVLEAAVLRYLGLLRTGVLTERESRETQALMEALVTFESLAAVIARDFAEIARQAGTLRPSAETTELLRGLYETVQHALELAVRAIRDADADAADQAVAMRETVVLQAKALLERQAARLRPDDPDYLQLARMQMSVVDKLARIYDLAARIARGVLPEASPVPG